MPSSITRAILFDMGNVVVAFDFRRAYAKLAPLCPLSLEDLRQRLRDSGLVHRLETGQIDPAPFVAEFCALLDIQLTYPEFEEIWASIFLPDTLIPESLFAALGCNYPLVLLSNTNAIHFDYISRNYTFLRHFHHLVLSHEVKAMKPAPEIYAEAVRLAGCQPEECFFADDIPEFVEGARSFGLDAVRFESASQIESELRSRGIAW